MKKKKEDRRKSKRKKEKEIKLKTNKKSKEKIVSGKKVREGNNINVQKIKKSQISGKGRIVEKKLAGDVKKPIKPVVVKGFKNGKVKGFGERNVKGFGGGGAKGFLKKDAGKPKPKKFSKKVGRGKPKPEGFFGKLKSNLFGESEEIGNERGNLGFKKSYDNGKRVKNVNRANRKIKGFLTILKGDIDKKKAKLDLGNKEQKREYIRTGIVGFDSLFDGKEGIPSGTSVLIEGGPGSGKTLFCLTTLYNLCKQGKKCLYMSFEEPEERLIHHMENFGWNPKELINKGLLRIKRFDAIDVSRSIEALLSAAKRELLIDVDPVLFPEDFQADFVVLDSLTSIASAFSGEDSRFRIYMEQLFRYLEKNKITNFLIREVSSPSHIGNIFKEQADAVSFLSDGIIVLYNVIYDSGEREFAIEILKMRGVSFKRKIVELKIIDKKGLEVNPDKILKRDKQTEFKLT